ncbi:MAG: hypothetical protein JWO44_1297 [Bacteroidetes bacterium]|jgi:hypothetical protein|nr:hypothetical protein [Bacteroidota bacterium]
MKKFTVSTGVFITLLSFSGFSSFAQTPAPSAPSSIPAVAKHADANRFEYIISGLSTATEATDLVTLFKGRPGIIDAVTDLSNHTVTVYAPANMPETDIREILKFAGKTIIRDPKEITKFY